MEDFVELAFEGADKVIDKHFHKVPDKFVDPDTYIPGRHHQKTAQEGERDQKKRQNSSSSTQSSAPRQEKQRPRHQNSRRRSPSPPYPQSSMSMDGRPRNGANSSPYLQDGPYVTPSLYSQQPPHQRPEYIPSPPPIGAMNPYYDPRDQKRYDYSPPRRPVGARRRSSSYHGPRRGQEFYSSDSDDQQLAVRNPRRHGSQRDLGHNSKDKHHDVKDEIKNQFTKSKEGIAGGVVGALVGGWATHKALESHGKDRGEKDAMLTLLGAAVGGLAVNAIVDKWEDQKEHTREKEEKWEDKWGSGDESGHDDRRSRNGRSRHGSRYDDDDRHYRR